jgi:DNA mismatch endonuclease (patch repair protein)
MRTLFLKRKRRHSKDIMSREARSALMGRIRGKNTKPELLVRQILWRLGYRYRIHLKSLPGCPDIVLSGRRAVVFVHGCFWHRHNCGQAYNPKTRRRFWYDKFQGNLVRDRRNLASLKTAGWRSLVVWECQTKRSEKLAARLQKFLGPV